MDKFFITKIQRKIAYNKVTQWFHKLTDGKEYEGTPAETIMEMNDLFLNLIKQKKLNLGVTEQVFRRNICGALCTMKYYQDTNLFRKNRKETYPADWNIELENMWREWLDVRCFKNWVGFWARIPVREWEEELPGWRTTMEYILMSHIQRETYLLVDDDIIVEDDNGDFIDSNYYENYDDRWD